MSFEILLCTTGANNADVAYPGRVAGSLLSIIGHSAPERDKSRCMI